VKRVRVEAYCDGPPHASDEEEPAVVERTMTIDDAGPAVLDLCASCDQALGYWRSLVESGPKPEAAPKRRRGRPKGPALPTYCPICGHESPTRSALGQHTRSRHEKGLLDLDTEE